VDVARANLEELLLDYEDYLRRRRLSQWTMDSPEANALRRVPQVFREQSDPANPVNHTDLTDAQRWALYSPWLDATNDAVRANMLICLIH
jgi:restriction system protein